MTNVSRFTPRPQWAVDLIEELGGSGGGGSSAWGSITGTLSAQTDLQTALNAKAASSHTHSIANVTGLQTALDAKQPLSSVLTATTASFTTADKSKLDGLSGSSGLATITVPNKSYEHSQTVAATGVTTESRISLSLSHTDDDDENCAEMLDIAAYSAAPGTDTITITAAFLQPTAGPIIFNWSAA